MHERVILAVGTEPAATDIFLCDFLPAAIAEIEDKTHGIIEILVWRLIPQPLDDPARVWQRDTRNRFKIVLPPGYPKSTTGLKIVDRFKILLPPHPPHTHVPSATAEVWCTGSRRHSDPYGGTAHQATSGGRVHSRSPP